MIRRIVFSALALLLVVVPSVAAGSQSLADQRAQHLQRGINTCCWFAQAPHHYDTQRLNTYITPDDIRLIHQLGFDHIRLSIDPDPLVDWQHGQPDGTAFVQSLDAVVKLAVEQHLAVIVDIHPEEHYKHALLAGTDSIAAFDSLWQALAAHFAPFSDSLVYFEIMNEPEQTDPARWQAIELQVAKTIRTAAPNNTIIAAGAHWSGLNDLLVMQPLPLDNVIYTFHDYEPFPFTHQGATWAGAQLVPLRHMPYPSTPDNVRANLSQQSTLPGKLFIEQYGLDCWNAERIDDTLDFAAQWSQMHHVPVYVGEFGVYKPYAPPADRAQWIHDMRVGMEKHHLGWAMWEYRDSFGLVTKQDGKTVVDPAVLSALGLSGKAH
jgi:hypothetical protein